MRRIDYQIEVVPCGQKISGFLKSKGYSEQNLVNLKKDEESVWLNGQCVHLNAVPAKGDRLTVCIREQEKSEQIVPVELPLDIVYEDEDLMVVNKAAGMPIHPSRNNFDNSLGNALAWRYKERQQPFVFRCINRLDRDTSGLTIVAKHMVSAAILGRMVADKSNAGKIEREYLAVVEGRLEEPKGTVCVPIARKQSRCLERVVDFARGDTAVTHYTVLEEYEDASLVALSLETGRTHQIRVHMSYLGHPLLGDFLYHPGYAANQIDRLDSRDGNCPDNGRIDCEQPDMKEKQKIYKINRQALHARRLGFRHPMTGAWMEFTAPMPEDMQDLLKQKRY